MENSNSIANKTNIFIKKSLYSLEAIKRAIYYFTDKAFFKIDENDDAYIISIEFKDQNISSEIIIKNIQNSILEEDVRIKIESETSNIRNSIYKRAIKSIKG